MQETSEIYRSNIQLYSTLIRKKRKLSTCLLFLKLILFIAALYFVYLGISKVGSWSWYVAGFLSVFFGLVYYFDLILSENIQFYENLKTINQQELDALNGDISSFDPGVHYIDQEHPYTFDLDIFGKGSIFQSINRTVTMEGADTLSEWMKSTDVSKATIENRQQAVDELSLKVGFRHNFRAIGLDKALSLKKIKRHAVGYSAMSHSFITRLFMVWLIIGTIGSLSMWVAGMISYHIPIVCVMVQYILVGSKLKSVKRIHNDLDGLFKIMSTYHGILKETFLHAKSFESSELSEIANDLVLGRESALDAFSELKRLLARFDQRNNTLIAFISNGLVLSDIRLIWRYDSWMKKFHSKMDSYALAIGKLDALNSLANFRYNHPDFCFPRVEDNAFLMAVEMGHPIIHAKSRVCNDFLVPGLNHIHIITGANMAGKSTFLRTVGVNLILASIGAPVCAKSFSFQPLVLFSSMRTSDNLINHTSYFQAELQRLKRLIDTIKTSDRAFVILDEILKGTNSKDKLTGSRLFIEKILQYHVSGIVATHDLELGNFEETHPDHFRNQHFDFEMDGDQITFDYQLRPGVAKNMNATWLLKQILSNSL